MTLLLMAVTKTSPKMKLQQFYFHKVVRKPYYLSLVISNMAPLLLTRWIVNFCTTNKWEELYHDTSIANRNNLFTLLIFPTAERIVNFTRVKIYNYKNHPKGKQICIPRSKAGRTSTLGKGMWQTKLLKTEKLILSTITPTQQCKIIHHCLR